MSARLPEKDRVRSIWLGGGQTVATTVVYADVLASHVFQDDVTVIGAQLTVRALFVDAHLNADAILNAETVITRQAVFDQPGELVRCALLTGWTGILAMGGGVTEEAMLMYPVGKGLEIDEGESLNLLAVFDYIGAGGTLVVVSDAIIYYTER